VTEKHERTLAETAEEILDRRASSLALETADEEVSDQLSLLLFRIADEWYAVPVSDVREIFQEYAVTTIPCVPEYILGVVNVRGEILSVTDPARLMQLGTVEPVEGVMPPAVVITDEEIATALVVDEIGDIVECSSDELEPPISIIDRTQAEFIAGSLHVGDIMVGLLSIERVLEPVVAGGRYER
jgi:purine-binding chemotaxis protein CheW